MTAPTLYPINHLHDFIFLPMQDQTQTRPAILLFLSEKKGAHFSQTNVLEVGKTLQNLTLPDSLREDIIVTLNKRSTNNDGGKVHFLRLYFPPNLYEYMDYGRYYSTFISFDHLHHLGSRGEQPRQTVRNRLD